MREIAVARWGPLVLRRQTAKPPWARKLKFRSRTEFHLNYFLKKNVERCLRIYGVVLGTLL